MQKINVRAFESEDGSPIRKDRRQILFDSEDHVYENKENTRQPSIKISSDSLISSDLDDILDDDDKVAAGEMSLLDFDKSGSDLLKDHQPKL